MSGVSFADHTAAASCEGVVYHVHLVQKATGTDVPVIMATRTDVPVIMPPDPFSWAIQA